LEREGLAFDVTILKKITEFLKRERGLEN